MTIIVGLLIVVLVFALLAPLDSMRWWERGGPGGVGVGAPSANPDGLPRRRGARGYVLYLSGIGAVDGTTDDEWERQTLAVLAADLPDLTFAADVFPYAVENRGLTQRVFGGFWERLWEWQRYSRNPLRLVVSYVINLRNALRVMVSADPRYGPTFNLAVAEQLIASLDRHGYDWTRRPPVVVLGYSGGGQIAVGAGWYLAGAGLPVSVISLAGVVDSGPGVDRLGRLWHLYGSRDSTQRLGPAVFPGRWPVVSGSAWNRGKRDGRVTLRRIGSMKHTGPGGYFDAEATGADGRPYREVTIDAVRAILAADLGPDRPAAS